MPNGNPNNAPEGGKTGTWVDPYRAYNFKLEILGMTEGHFTSCPGMGVKVHTIKYRQGGVSQELHHLPGPLEVSPITLRYGLTDSRELWQWFMSTVEGKVERKNVSIVLLGSDGASEVMRWNLINAWPSEWRGAQLDAMGHEAAIEYLTLVCDKLERD
jgi:phage tail-like protein